MCETKIKVFGIIHHKRRIRGVYVNYNENFSKHSCSRLMEHSFAFATIENGKKRKREWVIHQYQELHQLNRLDIHAFGVDVMWFHNMLIHILHLETLSFQCCAISLSSLAFFVVSLNLADTYSIKIFEPNGLLRIDFISFNNINHLLVRATAAPFNLIFESKLCE